MHLCEAGAPDRVTPLCDGLGWHLAVQAILNGDVPGRVYVDDPAHPRSALLRVKHRFHLAGAADNAPFVADVGALFGAEIYPQARAEGAVEFVAYYSGREWERPLQTVLAAKHPMLAWREYYRFRALSHDWKALLPEGMVLRPTDAELLVEGDLDRLDELREEMCSERPSVEAFLARSHGMCIQHDNALVAWCLSEYDRGDRCEIGIETASAYRRRGLATVAASALVERSIERGVTGIGWHCWRANVASGATARRVGFDKVVDYPVLFAWFDEAANLAVNGNMLLADGEPLEALAWFARALATGRAPAWASFGAARAAAAAGNADLALGHLEAAIEHGFTYLEPIRGAEELRSLHDSERWRRLMARLGEDAEAH